MFHKYIPNNDYFFKNLRITVFFHLSKGFLNGQQMWLCIFKVGLEMEMLLENYCQNPSFSRVFQKMGITRLFENPFFFHLKMRIEKLAA